MRRRIGLVVSFPEFYTNQFRNAFTMMVLVTPLLGETKLSAPNVKRNYNTWALPMWESFPVPLSSLLTL